MYVPVKPTYTYPAIRNWVQQVGRELVGRYPRLFSVATESKSTHRTGIITIDYLQNAIARNTAAPYTARAFAGAPVSTPLRWDELEKGGFQPRDFHLKNVPQRVQDTGDSFAGVLNRSQTLPGL